MLPSETQAGSVDGTDPRKVLASMVADFVVLGLLRETQQRRQKEYRQGQQQKDKHTRAGSIVVILVYSIEKVLVSSCPFFRVYDRRSMVPAQPHPAVATATATRRRQQ